MFLAWNDGREACTNLAHYAIFFKGSITPWASIKCICIAVRDTPVRIVAHPAGHRLGGAIWHIQWSNEDIVYAVGFNHR